jgi:hypothetical protein
MPGLEGRCSEERSDAQPAISSSESTNKKVLVLTECEELPNENKITERVTAVNCVYKVRRDICDSGNTSRAGAIV